MNINYVAPQAPQHMSSNVYSGGGGGASPQMYAAQQGAELDYMKLLQNAAGMGVTGRDVFQADAHMAAIEKQAEMHAWLSQQQMTMQDQQELTRSRAGLSEVDQLLAKGEINESDANWYRAKLRGRVDFLAMKDSHTRTQAMEEQKKALTAQNQATAEMQAQRLKISQMTASDRFHFEMDPTARTQMEAEVSALNPLLKTQNPAQFEMKVRNRAQNHGLGAMYKLQPDGKIEEVKHERSAGGTSGSKGAGGAMTDSQFASLHGRIEKSIKHDAEMAGKTIPDEEVKAKVAEELKGMGLPSNAAELQMMRDPAAQQKQKSEQGKAQEIAGKDASFAEIQGTNLSPGAKQAAAFTLGLQKKMIEQFGPYSQMKPDLKAKMDHYAAVLAQIKKSAGSENRVIGQGGQ